MAVIPFPQRPRHGEPAPVRPLNREARIHGTFRSPSGGLGTVTGWMCLDRFHVVSDHGEVPRRRASQAGGPQGRGWRRGLPGAAHRPQFRRAAPRLCKSA